MSTLHCFAVIFCTIAGVVIWCYGVLKLLEYLVDKYGVDHG